MVLLASPGVFSGQLYSQASLDSSSEPVPVFDMVNGWDGPFESGRYAFGDARLIFGIESNTDLAASGSGLSRWFVEKEERWHYSLEFSSGMSRYYWALEHDGVLDTAEDLSLRVRSFEADGARVGGAWRLSDLGANKGALGRAELLASLGLYRVTHYQFGELNGVAEAGESQSAPASAELDYYFDEDKILEYQDDFSAGWGASVDFGFNLRFSIGDKGAEWGLSVQAQDALNQWRFDKAGFTKACINFEEPENSVCDSQATVSGRSGLTELHTRILPTWRASLTNPDDWILSYFQHGLYQRLGIEKSWSLAKENKLGVQAFSTHQLGLNWSGSWWMVSFATDDLRTSYARDLDASVGFHWGW